MKQCGSSKSVQQFSSRWSTVNPQASQNFRPTVLSTCMCRQTPATFDFSDSQCSMLAIICRPMPYFRQGSSTTNVRMQAWSCSLQSSRRIVQAPMGMSLQKARRENSVYWLQIFMQRPVEYLTGSVSKLSLRSTFMFLSLTSPKDTVRVFLDSAILLYQLPPTPPLLIISLPIIKHCLSYGLAYQWYCFHRHCLSLELLTLGIAYPWHGLSSALNGPALAQRRQAELQQRASGLRQYGRLWARVKFIIMMQAEKQQAELPSFGKFNIFLLIKTAQNSFGLKNGDYGRYRNYCAHKVHKLRRNLGIKFGTKMKFIRKDIVKEYAHDSKILQIILFNAEKNWALANQTKFSTARKPSQKSRARFFSIKKYAKALEWARKLLAICDDRADSLTQLQAQAYQLFLEGNMQFERQNWALAQGKLIACREIMADVAKVSDSLSEKVCREKIDQIEQTIKFCNFKISKGKELSIAEIVELRKGGDASLSNLIDTLAQKRLNEMTLGEGAGEVRFGDERYPIREELIIKQKAKIEGSLLSLKEIKAKWMGDMKDEQLYEEVLSFYSDVVLQVEQAMRLCDSERQDPKKKQKYTQGELQILKKVSLLFTEMKMNIFIDRNTMIFAYSHHINRGRKSTPQTIAKLLTATITLLQELAEVTKEKGSISNTFQIQQVQLIDAKTFYLRTVRLLFVGQVYFNNSKLRQANGLWSECERCIKILLSKEEMNEHADNEHFIGSLIPLTQLLNSVRSSKANCLIAHFQAEDAKKDELGKKIADIEITEKTAEERPASNLLTLETLIGSKGECQLSLQEISKMPIIELPGRVQAVPTRPIFFDLFYQSLAYPSVEGKIKKQEAGKTSWWGRLFK